MTAHIIPYNSKRDKVGNKSKVTLSRKPAAGEMVAEQDGYVVNYVKGSSCADNKLVVKNTSSGKTAEIAGLNGCSFDPKKNAVIIFPQNEYVGVYSGPTNASEEIASVDLP